MIQTMLAKLALHPLLAHFMRTCERLPFATGPYELRASIKTRWV